MAYLYIEEYGGLYAEEGAQDPIPGELVTSQRVAVTGSSTASSALNSKTKFIKLTADVASQWNWNGDAVSTSPYLPAGSAQYFAVNKGTSSTTVEVIAAIA